MGSRDAQGELVQAAPAADGCCGDGEETHDAQLDPVVILDDGAEDARGEQAEPAHPDGKEGHAVQGLPEATGGEGGEDQEVEGGEAGCSPCPDGGGGFH